MGRFPQAVSEEALPPQTVSRSFSGLWVLVATVLASSMAFIDSSAVNVVLPVLQEDLDASVTQLQWVIEAYALMLSALLLVGGSLGDRLGRRRMFVYGVVIFAGASLWAGLSPNATQLIAARVLQGIGGALFVPGSLALIGSCFTDKERGSAIGTWSGASALTMAAGPVLGGWLATEFSWRWVFFINLPLAVIVVLIAITRIPESKDPVSGGRIDWWGAGAATVGLGALIYGLIESANRGFADGLVIATLALGAGLLIAFIVIERKVEWPMMPLGVFRSWSFSGANLLTVLLYGALGGMLFFLPLNLVLVQGYSATQAGAAFLPFVLIVGVLSRWAGGLTVKAGAKIPLVVGPSLAGVGFLMFQRIDIGGSYWTTFFPPIALFGLGMAITIAPLVTTVMGTVSEQQTGLASGVNNALSRAAGVLALAVFGIIVLSFFNASLDEKLADAGVPTEVVTALDGERVKLAGAVLPEGLDAGVAEVTQRAIDEAYVSAFKGIMGISAGLAFAGALVALFMVERRPKRPGTA